MEDGSNTKSRPQFGGRVLNKEDDVFEHNAWDNVEWDEEQESAALAAIELSAKSKVPEEKAVDYEEKSDEYWDKFYSIHQNRFFKNRNWLFTEFPELSSKSKDIDHIPVRVFNDDKKDATLEQNENLEEKLSETAISSSPEIDQKLVDEVRSGEDWMGEKSTFRILEIGCGTGSTVFPLLEVNTDPGLIVYCCDLSTTAVNLVKEHQDYKKGRCSAFVCDATSEWKSAPFPHSALDVVTLIFMASAVSPERMVALAENINKYMKPGGRVLFRDYARYDMAQLRFKPGKCIQDNFYVRGDGTRVYFFTQEDVRKLFEDQGFVEEQNHLDRRLQVNRGKKLKMYRIWIQAKYKKTEA